jgi:hypothetical protein
VQYLASWMHALVKAMTTHLIGVQENVSGYKSALTQNFFITESSAYTAKKSMHVPFCNAWKRIQESKFAANKASE